MSTTITPTENGPYRVQGEFRIVLPSGEELPVRQQVFLCRCGGSTRKPFCDGTHSRIGFQGATAAVAAQEQQSG